MNRASAVLVLVLAALLHGCLWGPLLSREALHDELVYATTEDGWEIALHHYRPAPGVPNQPIPIIICHGISTTERSWSLDDDRSLPRYLTARGWDVWSIDLRGGGDSSKPSILNAYSYGYDFDAYVTQDVPAVIAEVLKRTGAPRVNWVGHSMGGMVIYGYISRFGDEKLQSVAAIASPVAFRGVNKYFEFAKEYAEPVTPYMVTIRDESLVKMIAPFVGSFGTRMEYVIWNDDNIDRETEQLLAYNIIANMSSGVLQQLATVFARNKLMSADGKIDYVQGLGRMRAPLLVAAGISDNLVPPQNTLPAYEASGSKRKDFVVFSRANGFSADYGHVDLGLGDRANQDVYPVIEKWMREVQP